MSNSNYLIQELEKINAARVNRIRVSKLVLADKSLFFPLVELVFQTQNKSSIKAAWILEFVCNQQLDWLLEHLTYYTCNLPKVPNGSAVRSLAKICEIFALYLKKNPSEKKKYTKNINQIIETGLDWMISNHKIAIKVYTMQTLYILGQEQKWILEELKLILQKNIAKESFGYQNRALKILKKL